MYLAEFTVHKLFMLNTSDRLLGYFLGREQVGSVCHFLLVDSGLVFCFMKPSFRPNFKCSVFVHLLLKKLVHNSARPTLNLFCRTCSS